jgi:phosphatidylinositol dimannoside acyltransferase
MLGLLLPVILPVAERIAQWLPRPAAYAVADLAGRAWHRWSPARRRVVAANLARVCAATGRPTSGRQFHDMVRRAFMEHARYWLEVFRAPGWSAKRLDRMLSADEWAHWQPIFAAGAVVGVPHLGNFEPFAHFVAVHGISGVAPVEETRPFALYRFLLKRRLVGGQGVQLIPLSRAMRPMLVALRQNRLVALAADRDLTGTGVEVTFFGHPARIPAGPATLALRTGKPLLVARVLRTAPEQFHGRAWALDVKRSGDTARDVAALTEAMARRFEEAIAEAPEQWWGAFQPFWPDQLEPRS